MHYCVKAYPYEVCLTHASAVDGCIAAAEIGNFLFFRTHPSAACAHVICMRTRHMHAHTSYAYCVNEPFEEIKFHGLGCQESLSDKSNVVVEGV